jgi:hypothetical protein
MDEMMAGTFLWNTDAMNDAFFSAQRTEATGMCQCLSVQRNLKILLELQACCGTAAT